MFSTHAHELYSVHPQKGSSEINKLNLLCEVSQTISQQKPHSEILSQVVDLLHSRLNMKYGTITIIDQASGKIKIEVAKGLTPNQIQNAHYSLGEGITGQVAVSGRAMILPQTTKSPFFINRTKRLGSHEFSFICVPITLGKEVLGTLSVDLDYTPGKDLKAEAMLLNAIANMLSRVIKSAKIESIYKKQTNTEAIESDNLKDLVTNYEKKIILNALNESCGNMASAARALKTTPRILAYKAKSYGLISHPN